MTHSGGNPHAVGDRGQQYEIRCAGILGEDVVSTFGWATTLMGAAAMIQSIELHPSWHSPEVIDRCAIEPTQSVVPLDFVRQHAR